MVLREKLVKVYSLIIIAWLQECGGYSGFQVIMGMMELGRNPKNSVRFPTPPCSPPPKRINGLKINPPPAGPNTTTTTTTTVTTKKQTELRGRHTRAPSDCQTTQENICQIFLPPQNFGIEKFKPKNILRFFPSLKIQSNLPRSPIPLPRAWLWYCPMRKRGV